MQQGLTTCMIPRVKRMMHNFLVLTLKSPKSVAFPVVAISIIIHYSCEHVGVAPLPNIPLPLPPRNSVGYLVIIIPELPLNVVIPHTWVPALPSLFVIVFTLNSDIINLHDHLNTTSITMLIVNHQNQLHYLLTLSQQISTTLRLDGSNPPPNIARVGDDMPPYHTLSDLKSPKSTAFPNVAIVHIQSY